MPIKRHILESPPSYKDKEELYRLVIALLLHDGHAEVAEEIAKVVRPFPALVEPSEQLLELVDAGESTLTTLSANPTSRYRASRRLGPAMDLDLDLESPGWTPDAPYYETMYVTAHKSHCRVAAFNSDGSIIATGSCDASIKILNVERMLAKAAAGPLDKVRMLQGSKESTQQSMENHPVIKTLYDHIDDVSTLDFHPDPSVQMLASGSVDETINLFSYGKSNVKQATTKIMEVHPVAGLSFHPQGDYMVVGVKHPTVRLYNVETQQDCWVPRHPRDHHQAPLNAVRFSPCGRLFATACEAGDVKIWDAVSCRCVISYIKAHAGEQVCSVQFSRSGKYVISSGRDCMVKLWELPSARCLIAYSGAGLTAKQDHSSVAVFNHTEDHVFYPDEKTISLCCWNARSADRERLLSLSHNDSVRYIAHSPTAPALISCSEDFRARFWYARQTD